MSHIKMINQIDRRKTKGHAQNSIKIDFQKRGRECTGNNQTLNRGPVTTCCECGSEPSTFLEGVWNFFKSCVIIRYPRKVCYVELVRLRFDTIIFTLIHSHLLQC
jgi:hypothetical protein